jgi:hypothetical protein
MFIEEEKNNGWTLSRRWRGKSGKSKFEKYGKMF